MSEGIFLGDGSGDWGAGIGERDWRTGIGERGFGNGDLGTGLEESPFPAPVHHLIRFLTFLTTLINILIILEQSFNNDSANSSFI